MKRIYNIAVASLCIAVSQAAYSQNLDPTVEVSRAYVAKHIDAEKPVIEMAVPDSVLKFDLDFDYAVTDNPYKGSYEFKPYSLDMKPQSSSGRNTVLFFRAGAGYTLHPTLDFVVTPPFRKGTPFSMSIYGTHRSYFGRYRAVSFEDRRLGWDGKSRYSGYDTYTSAGVNARTDWRTGYFTFDLGYLGYAGKDTLRTRNFDAFRADVRVASNNPAHKYFFYDVNLSYLYGEDKIRSGAASCLTEHDFSAKASLGPVFSDTQRALLDIGLDVSDYGAMFSSYSGMFSLAPHYILHKSRWYLDLGVKISMLIGSDRSEEKTALHSKRGQIFYPDVEIGFDAVRNYLNIYIKAEGGDNINRYSDRLASDRHFSPLYALGGNVLMNNSVERIKASLGFKGNIASRLVYDLRGGYANYSNMMFGSITYVVPGQAPEWMSGQSGNVLSGWMPSVGYASCNYYFAALDLGWKSQDLSVDAVFECNGTDLRSRKAAVFAPSPFTADIDVVYNWKKRVFVGLHCNAALARNGLVRPSSDAELESVRLPGYADLGLSAEYRFNRKASFWIYGGNLLNMTVQRFPLYTESGISFTAGITLSL